MSKSNSNSFNLEEYKNELAGRIVIYRVNPNMEYPQYIITSLNNINNSINRFLTNLVTYTSKERCDNAYKTLSTDIKGIYKNVVKSFCSEYLFVTLADVANISYVINLNEFYLELIKARDKKLISISNDIERRITKYKLTVNYEDISKYIDELKMRSLERIKNGSNYEETLNYLDRDIGTLFAIYNENLARLTNLEYEINDSGCKELLPFIDELRDCYTDYDLFNKRITILEKMLKEKISSKVSSEDINKIYQNLLNRYYEVLKGCNSDNSFNRCADIVLIFNECVSILKEATYGKVPLDILFLINQIDFKNIRNDLGNIGYIKKNMVLTGSIYIKRDASIKYPYEREAFYYIDSNDNVDVLYLVSKFDVYECPKKDMKTLNSEYISIDDYLVKARYIGKEVRLQGVVNSVYLLYELGNTILYLDKTTNMVYPYVGGNYTVLNSANKVDDFYQNHLYIKSLLKASLDDRIKNCHLDETIRPKL